MGVTQTMAEFIVKLKYDDIPDKAIDIAKGCILDCMGVALAGSQETGSKIVAEYVKELGAKPEASVIAGGFKTAAPFAAQANGASGHALDYDDYTLITRMGHPTVAIMPSVLALGEKNKMPGKKALEAYITGLEIGSKIMLGLQQNLGHFKAGWHATSTVGTVASAVACSKLLGLDVQKTRMAMGIAGTMSSGLRQSFGTMMKPFHAGFSGSKGIMAALLAQKGFTGDANILEGPIGFGKVFSAETDLNKMVEGLGNPLDIIDPGISIKGYPCCAANHRHLDAILYLINKYDIKPADVVEVICLPSTSVIPGELIHHRPKTALEAKFSLEYNMAVALLDRKAGLEQFTNERVAKPDVQALLQKVKYEYPEVYPEDVGDRPRSPNRVTIKLKDGRVVWHEVTDAKGDPANPMTHDELSAKFRDCAQRVLSARDIERFIELAWKLEAVEDVSQLMNILVSGKAPTTSTK